MGRATDRYMCLGCGRFWRMPNFEIVPGQHRCPYCGDMYWVDNVQPNIPPPMFSERTVKTPCFHEQVVELFNDMNFCSICGNRLHGAAAGSEGESLVQWQDKLLRGLKL